MQQILARVRQNFGKINVVPEFSGDDLVPLEMSDVDDDELESCSVEAEEEERGQQGDSEEEHSPESQEEHVESDTRAVIKALDEKIAKYQKFLNKAKAKKFSAVRYCVCLLVNCSLRLSFEETCREYRRDAFTGKAGDWGYCPRF